MYPPSASGFCVPALIFWGGNQRQALTEQTVLNTSTTHDLTFHTMKHPLIKNSQDTDTVTITPGGLSKRNPSRHSPGSQESGRGRGKPCPPLELTTAVPVRPSPRRIWFLTDTACVRHGSTARHAPAGEFTIKSHLSEPSRRCAARGEPRALLRNKGDPCASHQQPLPSAPSLAQHPSLANTPNRHRESARAAGGGKKSPWMWVSSQ